VGEKSTDLIDSKAAAAIKRVSVRRIQQLAKDGVIPSQTFGGSLMFKRGDVAKAKLPPPGRPRKPK
jgi:hypothetical protein